ncbi:type VI secretion system Vgr family protein [Bacteroides sp. 224]|uniref:type VI secretion system Vgr family protein n=1 Tax=Bacteroides sp. 224 TaxID=2302936 RepID=UPI0013D21F92|nr:phage baseplate assembly protein V [Bacteroides sp. 224]NDV65321.1 hypothetical protein [Bacteroides sp. 224]
MATSNLLDEKHITNAFVYIEGDKMNNVVSLELNQEFGQHHRFKVVLDYDVASQSLFGDLSNQIALMGQTLDIDLQQGDDSAWVYEFRGVIDNVYTEGREGKYGYLVLEGSSPTNLLERGQRLDIFGRMSLQDVVEEVTAGVQEDILSIVNTPRYNVRLNFLMQYYESDWEFLQRLSAISGETLYYTGRDLVFGTHKDWEPFEVMYDREIMTLQFGSRLLANTFTNYQYLSAKDEVLRQTSPSEIENSDEYLYVAAQKAAELVTNRPTLLPASLAVEDKGALDDMVERRKTATASRSVYVRGVSKTCDPRIGRLLTISMPQGMGTSELGTYRVIKVVHRIDENHRYSCEFEAIPADLKFVPTPELKMPVASSVLATVIKNNDPEGLGRVQVEFPFARDRVGDAWLRVMSPDAGGIVGYGNKKIGVVEKNRGMVFIPEEGDQVMVGFEFGDPNRPYVMGSMFHGKNTGGAAAENAVKSIVTRSGHTVEFDDTKETLGITIKDLNGNVIHLDTKGSNIKISAPETLALDATNIILSASENVFMKVGENLEAIVNNQFSLKSNEITTVAKERMEETAKEYELTAQKVRIDSTKENMELASSKTIDIQSSEKVQLF